MPTLRERLTKPHPWLLLLGLSVALVMADAARQPAKQVSGNLFVAGVRLYQKAGRGLLAGRVACRYRPTCSDYSIEAVRRYGIARGVRRAVARIWSCTSNVAAGTYDPVP